MLSGSKQRLLDLLAMGRVANLPTVWSNVLVAVFLVMGFSSTRPLWSEGDFEVMREHGQFAFVAIYLGLPLLFASCFDVGGCLLGDASDAEFDAVHRPERPIPRGAFSPSGIALAGWSLVGSAWTGGCLFFLLGNLADSDISTADIISWAPGSLYELPHILLTTALALAIIAYARFHKRLGRGAPVLMALCRGLLVAWAAGCIAIYVPKDLLPVLPLSGAVFLYTLCISLVARHESNPNPVLPSAGVRLLFLLPPVAIAAGMLVFRAGGDHLSGSGPVILLVPAGAVFLAWSARGLFTLRRSVPGFVSMALAGFCLVDACFAAFIGWPMVVTCFGLFLVALLLQKIAPAT